jgi:uncharacterized membrane protein
MQSIYTYIPETNHVPKEYDVVAILLLLFMVLILLAPALALMYFYISTFRSVCVQCSVWEFSIIIIIIIIIITNTALFLNSPLLPAAINHIHLHQ